MSDTRRDGYGRYLVVPPDGNKPTGYTRATTIAKVLDSEGGLVPWKATMAVVGLCKDRGLNASWQALIAQHSDPWYDTPESKTKAKALVEQCAIVGGSGRSAQVGTALHAMTDQVDMGNMPLDIGDDHRADLDAYSSTLAAAGIVVDRTLIERIVVLDKHKIAGTADRLAVTLADGRRVVADLKTGADLTYSWNSIAVQLAIYANGDAMYSQGEDPDGLDDRREPMPTNLSREVGLVIHLPAGKATCQLYFVDLIAGFEALELSLKVKAWRARRNLATAHKIAGRTAILAVSHPPGAVSVVGDSSVSPTTATVDPPPFDDAPLATVTPISRQHKPTLRESQQARSDAIDASRAKHPSTLPVKPDEGPAVDAADGLVVKAHYEQLPVDRRLWLSRFVTEAERGGVSFHLTEKRTMRRFEILRGLVALCTITDDVTDQQIIGLVAAAIGHDFTPSDTKTGAVIGALHVSQAIVFADLCCQFADSFEPTPAA